MIRKIGITLLKEAHKVVVTDIDFLKGYLSDAVAANNCLFIKGKMKIVWMMLSMRIGFQLLNVEIV